MAEEKESLSPEARTLEILRGILRQLLIIDWTENRVQPTMIRQGEDFKFAQGLVPNLTLTREEFNKVVLPILEEAARVTERCKDVLPIGVQIIRKTVTRDPDTKEPLTSTERTRSSGVYAGKRSKDAFGQEKEEDEDKEE
ncbi:MAG: hypothetical protein M3Q73_01630 [bacterium]|nr:hypothetical protein [bacterium]